VTLSRWRTAPGRWLGAYAALAYLFLHLPLAILMIFSLNGSRFTVWEGFSLHWYADAFRDAELMESAMNSLIVAACATAVATAVGTLCAYALWKRGSRWMTAGLTLSLVTPEVVMGISLLAFFQWIFRHFDFRLGMHTVILAHVMFSVVYVVAVVLARLRTMDRSLEEAAMDLGATGWQAFLRVTLPLLAPAIGAAALLAFTISFDDYVITSLVAGVDSQTLPMVLYAMARRGANPVVNAISTLIVALIGALILLAERLRER
jgi:spermidine/putrescine transport system permease protein